ncbi:unnamed protein product [Rhizophagus irregularis]|nr:unnamed protein product [Rhizophagus irregularis]
MKIVLSDIIDPYSYSIDESDNDSGLNEEEEDSIALNTFFRSQYSFSGGGQGTTHFLIMLALKKEENAWHKTL